MNAYQSQKPTLVGDQTTPSYPHEVGPLAVMVPISGAANANQGPTQSMTLPVLINAGTVNADQSYELMPVAGQATPWLSHSAELLAAMVPNAREVNANQGPQPVTIPVLANAGTVNANHSQKPMAFFGQVTSSCHRVAESLDPKPPNAATLNTALAHLNAHDVVSTPYSSIPNRSYSSIVHGNDGNSVQNTRTHPFVLRVK
jgi:hypothetical protein